MPITTDDFILFCTRTIDGIIDAVERLDDEQVNRRPALPGANTPYQLVTHALGAFDWWTSHVVCGLPSDRDRDSEFVASGTVDQLITAAHAAKRQLLALAAELDAATELHASPHTQKAIDAQWTVGAALIHAYEELAQHLGHLEITVDLLSSPTPE